VRTPRSIRFKLISLYVGLLSLVFVCFGAYIYWGVHASLVGSLDLALDRRARQITANILTEAPTQGPGFVASEIQARYAPELNERVIRITGPNGQVVYASKNVGELSGVISVSSEKTRYRNEKADGTRLRVAAVQYRSADGQLYTVEVGAPLTSINGQLDWLLLMLALGVLALIVLAIVAGYLLLGRALRPVDEIVRAAEGLTYQNLNERLPVPRTGDEFERISEALNRMIGRLDEAFRVATRFSGDASHELRTPITVIRGELEALLKGPLLAPELRQRIGEILVEMERLTHIVEGLLLVSRLESGEGRQAPELLDLGDIAGHVADQMEPLAEDRQQTLWRELERGVCVEGDPVRLKQVVVNLLDNAFKYTPVNGRVTLSVHGMTEEARLEVSDTGVGISAKALPHVFDRFFRAEEMRAGQIEGTGLGLAIVHSIVEAHGGAVSVTSREGKGTSFVVRLPRAGRIIGKGLTS
jgi:heavy metal sensor kinase